MTGVSYNVFDGIELLQHSIDCIRKSVDYINVVYQTVSNRGEKDETVLKQLQQIKGIDELIPYSPNLYIQPKQNETIKRQVGFDIARSRGCKYWINMDTDEMYIKSEFQKAFQTFVDGNYDSSACQMITYYKWYDRAIFPFETYYVPLFFKVDNRTLGSHKWDVVADSSRKLQQGKLKVFSREEIQMHHYSLIRKDFAKKIRNKSAAVNWPEMIEPYAQAWEGCTRETMKVLHPHRGLRDFVPLHLIKLEGPVKVNSEQL